jgi:hypothetical protein
VDGLPYSKSARFAPTLCDRQANDVDLSIRKGVLGLVEPGDLASDGLNNCACRDVAPVGRRSSRTVQPSRKITSSRLVGSVFSQWARLEMFRKKEGGLP